MFAKFAPLLCFVLVSSVSADDEDINSRMNKLESSIAQLQTNVQILARNGVHKKTSSSPEVRLEDPVYVCVDNTLDISCNSTTLIMIETAEYGNYIDNCLTCCDPQPSDCNQNMAQTNLQQWQALNAICNGVQTCSYDFEAQDLTFCEPDLTADYLQVFYSCNPPNPIQPQEFIGFSAAALTSQTGSGLIEFNDVLTNEGNHYSTLTSRFTCPINGFYFFYTNIQQQLDSTYDICYAYITKDGVDLALAENDDETSSLNFEVMMSTSVITECAAGETVYVETTFTECNVALERTNFGGFLIAAD